MNFIKSLFKSSEPTVRDFGLAESRKRMIQAEFRGDKKAVKKYRKEFRKLAA